MKKPTPQERDRIEAKRGEDAERRFQASVDLMSNDNYVEFYVKPNKAQATEALSRAMVEALKPAGTRIDALVVEHLRDYMTYNEIATAAQRTIDDTLKSRRRAEEEALQKSVKP